MGTGLLWLRRTRSDSSSLREMSSDSSLKRHRLSQEILLLGNFAAAVIFPGYIVVR